MPVSNFTRVADKYAKQRAYSMIQVGDNVIRRAGPHFQPFYLRRDSLVDHPEEENTSTVKSEEHQSLNHSKQIESDDIVSKGTTAKNEEPGAHLTFDLNSSKDVKELFEVVKALLPHIPACVDKTSLRIRIYSGLARERTTEQTQDASYALLCVLREISSQDQEVTICKAYLLLETIAEILSQSVREL